MSPAEPGRRLTVFLGGDVMTGRGVDQILPCPGDPRLTERFVDDARTYVRLAERVNGAIPSPVQFAWPWGAAVETLDDVAPDVRLINLETTVTRRGEPADGKGVHYRMSPENIPCLTAIRPDACVLANNHALDFGHLGLTDTLDALAEAGIAAAGAGRVADEARRPAIVPVESGGRVVVLSFGTRSSGIPGDWAVTGDRPGVDLLPDLSDATADRITVRVRQVKRPGDVVVASLHWGSNWGYEVPAEHVRFARRIIEGGVDVVYGHSSHHPRPIEIHRGKLILYGCGDLIDDYEGIGGHQWYRDELRLLYFATIDPATGDLARLRMTPLRARQMRLRHADRDDAEYLRDLLARISHPFGVGVDRTGDGPLEAHIID